MTPWWALLLIALGLTVAMFLLNWFHVWWIKKMLRDFVRLYPDRCPICAFHRHGIETGELAKEIAHSEHLPKPEEGTP